MSDTCEPRLPGVCKHPESVKETEHWADWDYDWFNKVNPSMSDQDLNRLSRWTRSVQPRLVIKDEQRQYKILRLAEQPSYPLVQVGLPQYEPKQLGQAVSPRVMPTAQPYHVKIDRGGKVEKVPTNQMRLSCSKWLNPVLRTRGSRSRGGQQEVDPTAMADLERRLGIKLG